MTTASTASRAGFRRLLAIVSAVLLALAFSLQTIPASAAMTEEQLYAQQKELQKKADELKKQLANTNDNLEDSQARLKNMKSQVDNARQQLENINQRLSSLNSQISGKNSEIAAKESAISQKEANIQDASDKLNERLRALSKRGNLSSVQMMLSTEEYAEYLIKSKMLERIAENDQKALNDMEAELTKIKADKSALETDKQALADRKKQEQALQNEASAKKKEMENLYKAIQAEEKKILAQANNYKAQIEKNKKLLDDIDKEIQKIIDSKSNNNGQYGGGTGAHRAEHFLRLRLPLGYGSPRHRYCQRVCPDLWREDLRGGKRHCYLFELYQHLGRRLRLLLHCGSRLGFQGPADFHPVCSHLQDVRPGGR